LKEGRVAETFIAIGASIGKAASATAASISSMFGGTAAGAGAASASSISTALSIGSALSSVAAGFSGAAAKRDQAEQVGVQAAQQRAQDSQRRATLAEEYQDLVANQEAIQIANGLNPGVGTPASVRRATREVAERNLSVSRENTRARSATARLQRRSLFRGANTAILGGFTGAANTLAGAYEATGFEGAA